MAFFIWRSSSKHIMGVGSLIDCERGSYSALVLEMAFNSWWSTPKTYMLHYCEHYLWQQIMVHHRFIRSWLKHIVSYLLTIFLLIIFLTRLYLLIYLISVLTVSLGTKIPILAILTIWLKHKGYYCSTSSCISQSYMVRM